MAIRIELPKDILKAALEQAAALRNRNINAATNAIIKQALEEELKAITIAKDTLTEIK